MIMATRRPKTRTLDEAIALAESLLPGAPAPEGEDDPRWQAVIEVSGYIQTDSERVWQFICRWGVNECPDLRTAIATCLLEELLAECFEEFFPKVKEKVLGDARFAGTFAMCWKLGQAEIPSNAAKFDSLQLAVREQ
jgi:hypothetical protein